MPDLRVDVWPAWSLQSIVLALLFLAHMSVRPHPVHECDGDLDLKRRRMERNIHARHPVSMIATAVTCREYGLMLAVGICGGSGVLGFLFLAFGVSLLCLVNNDTARIVV